MSVSLQTLPAAPSAEAVELSVTLDGEWWFRHFARIKPKDGQPVTGPEPNILQRRAFKAYRECQLAGVPCLMMILKPRQKGASTIAEAIHYHHQRRYRNLNGVIMGDVDSTSDKVFEMYKTLAESDRYPWSDRLPRFVEGKNLADEVTLGNGSKWWKETAGSKNAGRSGTVQCVHMDEVAFYPMTTGRDPTLALLGSFYSEGATSLAIATSTPCGATGWFYNTWRDTTNNWIKIFAAWFEFEDSTLAFGTVEERAHFVETMDDDEIAEKKLYGVSLEQLHWRRFTIKNRCEGDVDKFRQEFPSNDRDCFLLSSRPRFDAVALRNLRIGTEVEDKNGRRGVLVPQSGGTGAAGSAQLTGRRPVSFRLDPEVGTQGVRIWEEARLACRYVIGVDTCRGKDQQLASGTTADPDWHSVQCWRAATLDAMTGVFLRAKLVAHHHSRVEADVLADIVAALSWYYGNCLVVPELNDGAGFYLVKELHRRGVNLYRRQPLRMAKPGMKSEEEKLEAFGWNTDKATKRWVVDACVPLIRDELIDLSDVMLQDEFESFVVNKHGQAEAMPGRHDDTVLAAAISLYNIGAATEYRALHVRSVDLMRLVRDPRYKAPKGFRRG